MSERIELTDAKVKTLPRKKHRYTVADDLRRGLFLRVGISGTRSWSVQYRYKGKVRRKTLGRYPHWSLAKARDAALDVLSDAAHGRDPDSADPSKLTFQEVFHWYLATLPGDTPNRAAKRRAFEKDVLPFLGELPITEVTDEHIEDVLKRITSRPSGNRGGQIMANRTRSMIGAMYSWAVKKRRRTGVTFNPVSLVDKYPAHRRDRRLSTDEVRAFWQSLDSKEHRVRGAVPQVNRSCLRLLLLTGVRVSELTGATWEEIDWTDRLWTVPPERTKTKESAHRVPLSDLALAELRALREVRDSKWVAPSRVRIDQAGRVVDRHIESTSLPRYLRRHRKRFGFQHFHCHDLRRSAVTMMADKLDARWEVLQGVLHHVPPGPTSVYVRAERLGQRRALMQRWADFLRDLTA